MRTPTLDLRTFSPLQACEIMPTMTKFLDMHRFNQRGVCIVSSPSACERVEFVLKRRQDVTYEAQPGGCFRVRQKPEYQVPVKAKRLEDRPIDRNNGKLHCIHERELQLALEISEAEYRQQLAQDGNRLLVEDEQNNRCRSDKDLQLTLALSRALNQRSTPNTRNDRQLLQRPKSQEP